MNDTINLREDQKVMENASQRGRRGSISFGGMFIFCQVFFFFFSYLSYDHQNEPGNKVVPFIFYRWISQGSKSINNYLRTTLPIGQAFEFTQPDDKAYYLSWPY